MARRQLAVAASHVRRTPHAPPHCAPGGAMQLAVEECRARSDGAYDRQVGDAGAVAGQELREHLCDMAVRQPCPDAAARCDCSCRPALAHWRAAHQSVLRGQGRSNMRRVRAAGRGDSSTPPPATPRHTPTSCGTWDRMDVSTSCGKSCMTWWRVRESGSATSWLSAREARCVVHERSSAANRRVAVRGQLGVHVGVLCCVMRSM
jgi:hypothetical protein